MAYKENIHSITTKKVSEKVSFFKTKYCHLIFTDKRIIVAYYDPDKAMDEYKKRLQEQSDKGSPSSVYNKVSIRFQSTKNFYQRYLCMNPEDIIKEHPENFAIPSERIKSLVFSKGSCCKDEDGFESHNPDKLNITLKNNAHKNFYLKTCFFNELCDALSQIIPQANHSGEKMVYKS